MITVLPRVFQNISEMRRRHLKTAYHYHLVTRFFKRTYEVDGLQLTKQRLILFTFYKGKCLQQISLNLILNGIMNYNDSMLINFKIKGFLQKILT